MLGLMTLTTMGLTKVGIAQATAEELTDLQYDEQTRSLTLTLPESVTPQVSVLTPNQLILELPDTHVGELHTHRIQDGVVDSIVLEQATPETARVVMEFAEGTVLSASQSAVPVADADSVHSDSGEQAWEVRPALTATSRRADTEAAATPGASASSLRTASAEIAQAPDFSELPVLEPAVPIDEPVSVPPLDSPISVPPFEPELVDSDSTGPALLEPETAAVDVEVIPAPEETAAVSEPVPMEPPFLDPPFLEGADGLENVAESSDVESDWEAEELDPAADMPLEPIFIDLDVADEVDEGNINEEFAVTDSTDASSEVGVEDSADSRIASGQDVSASDEVFVPDVTAEPGRWPEPIPFGQPLPR